MTYEIELALSSAKAVITTFDFPDLPGAMVAEQIEKRLVAILPAIPRPGCLFVSGGETLATVCKAVKSEVIEVIEELLPGVPISRMGGEQWNNVLVISKSGAFGQPTTLLDIIQNFKEVRYA